jgi:acyl carrier protein
LSATGKPVFLGNQRLEIYQKLEDTMEIVGTIEKFIVDEIIVGEKGTELDPDASLISSGIVDSLALLRLIAFIEEKFGVVIEDEEVVSDNFETLNVMKGLVESKL